MRQKIITISLSPCWDKTIEVKGINWGQHKVISTQKTAPAGKALNINKALAQMGIKSISAGLWGSDDWYEMKKATADLKDFVQIRLTKAKGKTRENITVIDTAGKRQIHLRSKSSLANEKSLSDLNVALKKIITKDSICIFTGAMPEKKFWAKTIGLIETAKKKMAKIVVDTSGSMMRKIVAKGGLFIIKPNVEELGEIIGRKIPNQERAIIAAAKKLLNKAMFVLVSRGEKGAILAGKDVLLSARYVGRKYDVYNTVGCGDFLLAGFIGKLSKTDNLKTAIAKGLEAATQKAFNRKY